MIDRLFRSIGLLAVMVAVVISFSSFVPSVETAFVPPDRVRESRPDPLPYGVDHRFVDTVLYYADETGLPFWMLCRMFGQESVGDPMAGWWNTRAVSWAGARGLAQLMPKNLAFFSHLYNEDRPIDPFDPVVSIKVGSRYMADLVASAGWRIGVMAYNGGLGHWTDPVRYGGFVDESIVYAWTIIRK